MFRDRKNLAAPAGVYQNTMSMVRAAALVLGAALAGSLSAQTNDPARARQMIVGALADLNGQPAATVSLSGWESFGDLAVPISVEAAVQRTTIAAQQTAQMEVQVERDGRLVHRLAGDGAMVWSYSARRNDYASAVYHQPGMQAGEALALMLGQSARWAPREADFAVRLLRDIFLLPSNAGQMWTPWLSSSAEAWIEENEQSTWALITYRSVDNAVLTYSMVRQDENSAWTIQRIDYEKISTVGRRTEQIRWTASITAGLIPIGTDYTFTPPAGARPRSIGI